MNPSNNPNSKQQKQEEGSDNNNNVENSNTSPMTETTPENIDNVIPGVAAGGDAGGNRVSQPGGAVEGVSSGGGRRRQHGVSSERIGDASSGGAGGIGGGGVSEGQGMTGEKRTHVQVSGQSEQQPRPRKKGELINVPENAEPKCSVCKKQFDTWKAVFGHMRVHKRDWKGAFRPPTFNASEVAAVVEKDLLPAMLKIAHENLENLGGRDSTAAAGGVGASSSSAALRQDGLVIDLNDEPKEEKSSDESLDLNKTPED